MSTAPNFPLPEPYADGTPQDHADALRDYADPRIGGPMLDYFALAGAALIERQEAQIQDLLTKLGEATDHLMRHGWDEVAARMDRWGAAGYVGDWQDPEYDDGFDGGAR